MAASLCPKSSITVNDYNVECKAENNPNLLQFPDDNVDDEKNNKKDDVNEMNACLTSYKTLDMSTYFKLSDLIPYTSWAVPLHDSNALAYIGRIIVSYTGTKIKFNINTANKTKFKCCCSAPDGSFYAFFESYANVNHDIVTGYYVTNYGKEYKPYRIYNWNNTNTNINLKKMLKKDFLLPDIEFIAIGSSKKKLKQFKTQNKNVSNNETDDIKTHSTHPYTYQNGIFNHIAMIFNSTDYTSPYGIRCIKGSDWYEWYESRSLLSLYGENNINKPKFKVIENLSHIRTNNTKILYLWRQKLPNKIYMIRGVDPETVETSNKIHEFNVQIRKQQKQKQKLEKKKSKNNGLELKNSNKKNKNKKLNKRTKSIILSDEQAQKKRDLLP
eukprot:254966_1